MNIVAIAAACAKECERQRVGLRELNRLITAYQFAVHHHDSLSKPLSELTMRTIAATIDPNINGQYRSIPVTFANGGTAASPETIPDTMNRMFELLDENTDVDEFIKAFLQVHPFVDGNGRTAFILYNWLKGTLNNPLPLPDYFGGRD